MLTRKVLLGILFILGISLLNVAVLIEASNQESQLFVDPAEQQPIRVDQTHQNRRCHLGTGYCHIMDNNSSCTIYDSTGKCWQDT